MRLLLSHSAPSSPRQAPAHCITERRQKHTTPGLVCTTVCHLGELARNWQPHSGESKKRRIKMRQNKEKNKWINKWSVSWKEAPALFKQWTGKIARFFTVYYPSVSEDSEDMQKKEASESVLSLISIKIHYHHHRHINYIQPVCCLIHLWTTLWNKSFTLESFRNLSQTLKYTEIPL